VKLCVAILAVTLSGCVTSTVMQLAGRPGPPSHQADQVLSAYQLADGNIVLFVKGRLQGVKGKSEFSLLVPKAELERMRAEHATTKRDARLFTYSAPIGPSGTYMADGWLPIPIRREKSDANRYSIPADREPVLYELPRALDAENGKGLREYWGDVMLVFVEPGEDQRTFRVDIAPNAQRVKGNASKWLPITVPADIVTLPVQAMWAALFVAGMAGVAAAESQAAAE
jgi:hypothetical protein